MARWRVLLAVGVVSVHGACGAGDSAGPGATPVDGVRSTLSATPERVVADGATSATLVAIARDATGAPVQGRQATFTVRGADGTVQTFSSGDRVTDEHGVVSAALVSTRAEAKDVAVEIDGVVVAQHATVTFTPGGAKALAFTAAPAAALAGEPFSAVVVVLDAYGNAVTGSSAAVSLALLGGPSGAALEGGGERAASDGAARFDALAIERAGAGYVLAAASPGLEGTASAPFAVVPGAPSLEATIVAASPRSIVAGGEPATIAVTVVDAFGNPVPGVEVTLGVDAAGDALVQPAAPTGADGVATGTLASTRAGARVVSAALGGVPVARQATVAVVAGAPVVDAATFAGPAADVVAGTGVAAFSLRLVDAWENPVAGFPVSFSATNGVLSADAATGLDGVASATLQSRHAATEMMTATFAGASRSGTVQFVAGPPSELVLDAQPEIGTVGTTLAPVVVSARDYFGNVASPPGNVLLSLVEPLGVTLHGTLAAAPVGTAATFADLWTEVSGSYILRATSGALHVDGNAFWVAPGSAFSLRFAQQPPAALTAGAPFDVAVRVLDRWGNPVHSEPVVSVSLAPSGTLLGEASRVASSGQAVFSGLSVLEAAPGYRLLATSPDLVTATSATFEVRRGGPSASGSTLVASPASVPDDGTPTTLTATIADAGGNPIPDVWVDFSASGRVTWWQQFGLSDGEGKATGEISTLDRGVQTITASVGGIPMATLEFEFTAAPPGASASSVLAWPQTVPADGATASAVRVHVSDTAGRSMTGQVVQLAYSGAGTVTPTSATTDAAGDAQFKVTATRATSGALEAIVNPGDEQLVLPPRPTIAFFTPYRIGGTVAGLTGDGLFLSTPGQNGLSVPTDATSFRFDSAVPDGTAYDVKVIRQPWRQQCEVRNGTGTVAGADVADVAIVCRPTWEQVAAGQQHTVALRPDTTLWAWGSNAHGQLGDGTTIDRESPVQIGSGFVAVAAGGSHTVAVKYDGTLWAWGYNVAGQVGDGTAEERHAPVQIGTGYRLVAAGMAHTVAIKNDGTVWAWGSNYKGQIGNGTLANQLSPVQIGSAYASIAAGAYHSAAVKMDGTLLAWGSNAYGQLGDGTTADRPLPGPALGGTGFASVSAGAAHTVAVKADGTLWTFGSNANGRLGDGTTIQRTSPVQIGSGFRAAAAGGSHTLAVKTDRTLWAWGWNAHGQVGTGTTADALAPVQVGSGFASVSAGGAHSAALNADGTLWTWGYAASGELGNGQTMHRSAPVRIGSAFASAVAGYGHAAALDAGGILWAWGWNARGQLGDGTIADAWAPLRIGPALASIAAGYGHTVALDAGGTLWAWGSNAYGQLGDGTTVDRHAPVAIASGFAAIAAGYDHTLAIRSDGTLWAWGRNDSGQLGDGTTIARPAPVPIDSGFVSVAAGHGHTVAIAADGALWAWGANDRGQLGDGTTTERHVPAPVRSGVASVAAGYQHTLAIDAGGALWAWGRNDFGQVGDGTTADRLDPAPLAAGVVSVAAGFHHTLASKADGTLWAWGYNASGQLGDWTTTQRTSPVEIAGGFAAVAAGGGESLGVEPDGTLWAWGDDTHGQVGDGWDRTVPSPIP
jgi:alpha-tubulin suppressor-like RCC1 family protein